MQDPNKHDKLEAKDIRLGGPTLRRERQHGKIYRWFDNFWYHHKWKTLISLFLVIVILVCTLQMCTKEEDGDISVMLVGPYGFVGNEVGLVSLRSCLSQLLPEDYDGDGARKTDIVHYTIYSKEQIDAYLEHVNEYGEPDPIRINTATNTQEYQRYHEYVMTGETSIGFLDPWLAAEMASKEGDYIVNIQKQFGVVPEGAAYFANASGEEICYGVRLGDTAIWREYSAIRVLPEDTVIVLYGPYFIGKSGNEKEYAKVLEYYAALIGIN